ncbi:hypothetical protein niasHS_016799 [Heterodera schachtii]|uniref:Uncharacterized protein n=1 Tax=Heterodera schachtii TaxID=97005 RepID=A0ABD2I407_HETSC
MAWRCAVHETTAGWRGGGEMVCRWRGLLAFAKGNCCRPPRPHRQRGAAGLPAAVPAKAAKGGGDEGGGGGGHAHMGLGVIVGAVLVVVVAAGVMAAICLFAVGVAFWLLQKAAAGRLGPIVNGEPPDCLPPCQPPKP